MPEKKSKRLEGGPSGPHEFVPPEDPRAGLALATARFTQPAMMMVADYSLLEPHCKTCGRPRGDPMHSPPDPA